MTTDQRCFQPKDAAAYLGISRSTIWRYIRAGKLPTMKLGAIVLIEKSALDALLQTPTSPSPP